MCVEGGGEGRRCRIGNNVTVHCILGSSHHDLGYTSLFTSISPRRPRSPEPQQTQINSGKKRERRKGEDGEGDTSPRAAEPRGFDKTKRINRLTSCEQQVLFVMFNFSILIDNLHTHAEDLCDILTIQCDRFCVEFFRCIYIYCIYHFIFAFAFCISLELTHTHAEDADAVSTFQGNRFCFAFFIFILMFLLSSLSFCILLEPWPPVRRQ